MTTRNTLLFKRCRIHMQNTSKTSIWIPTHVRPFDKITFHSEYKSLKPFSTRGTHTKNRKPCFFRIRRFCAQELVHMYSHSASALDSVHQHSCKRFKCTGVFSLRRNPTGPYAVGEYTLCTLTVLHSCCLYAVFSCKCTVRVHIGCKEAKDLFLMQRSSLKTAQKLVHTIT